MKKTLKPVLSAALVWGVSHVLVITLYGRLLDYLPNPGGILLWQYSYKPYDHWHSIVELFLDGASCSLVMACIPSLDARLKGVIQSLEGSAIALGFMYGLLLLEPPVSRQFDPTRVVTYGLIAGLIAPSICSTKRHLLHCCAAFVATVLSVFLGIGWHYLFYGRR